jgi:hypothetical protein
MQRHCEKWLNKTALRQTPFQAVKSEKGRKKVIELLKLFENGEESIKSKVSLIMTCHGCEGWLKNK